MSFERRITSLLPAVDLVAGVLGAKPSGESARSAYEAVDVDVAIGTTCGVVTQCTVFTSGARRRRDPQSAGSGFCGLSGCRSTSGLYAGFAAGRIFYNNLKHAGTFNRENNATEGGGYCIIYVLCRKPTKLANRNSHTAGFLFSGGKESKREQVLVFL